MPGLTMPTNALPDLPDNTIRLCQTGLKATNVSAQTWFGYQPANSGYEPYPTADYAILQASSQASTSTPIASACRLTGSRARCSGRICGVPAYFDSDLALFKNFQITERQKLQFRISAVNFLNHPLRQFGLAATADETISFTDNYTTSIMAFGDGSAGNECAMPSLTCADYCHHWGVPVRRTAFLRITPTPPQPAHRPSRRAAGRSTSP